MKTKRRNPNRPVVLALHDAAALHRWLELLCEDRRFFNPIEAADAERAFHDARVRLGDKVLAIVRQHGGVTDEARA